MKAYREKLSATRGRRLILPIMASASVLALTALASAPAAKKIEIGTLQQHHDVKLRLPMIPDSSARADHPFNDASLFQSMPASVRNKFRSQRQDYTTILPDTAGVYHLSVNPVDSTSATISRVSATIRPDSFFEGTLKVSTPRAATIYINGKNVAEKLTQDSVAKPVEVSLKLEPAADTDITIDLLTTSKSLASPSVEVSITPATDSESVNIAQNPGKQVYNIMSTVIGPRVSSVRLSPDGRYMIVTVSETADGKTTAYTSDVRECATGHVVVTNLPEDYDWLPGSKSTLYYNLDRTDNTFDIMTMEVPGGKTGLLATSLPDKAESYMLSPQGDYLIYYDTKEAEKTSGVMRRIENPDDRIPGNRTRMYLNMIDFSDGVTRPLTSGGVSTMASSISADGNKLLYISATETPSRYPFYEYNLVSLDVRTLTTDTLLRRETTLNSAVFSPDAKSVFITAGPSFANGLGANSGEASIPNDFDTQGYLLDIKSGVIRPLTRDFNPSLYGEPVWNSADNLIYCRATKGFDVEIIRINPTSGDIEELPLEIEYIRNFSIGENESRYLAYTGMSYTYMGRACLLDLKSGKSTLIADPMQPLIADTEWGDVQMWSFTAPDGTLVEGTLTLPPNFDPSKKYPAIVYYYGGTTPSTRTNHSPYSPQLFASRGYVVYCLNPSGTIGYGQQYSARHVNAWGERTADEIIYGTQRLCEQFPFIDKEHIGCIGASYGGFMTQLLTTRTDIFAAAVSHAGISNVASYWGEGYWGYSYNAVAAAKSYPWSNPDIFTRNSALFNADKIHTPLLLLHGSVDTNVPIGESIQLFNALKILGRDVEFVTVDGENHIIMDFEKRKEWHATIMAWFDKWLKNDPRWWNSIYK